MIRAQTYMHRSGHMGSFHARGFHKTMMDLHASDSSELYVSRSMVVTPSLSQESMPQLMYMLIFMGVV